MLYKLNEKMNPMKVKYLILLMIVGMSQSLFSQENNKFGLTFEYSPNYSKITDEFVNAKFKLSHNILLRISYKAHEKIKPTIGLGFLNPGELFQTEIVGDSEFESLMFIHSNNYMYVPFGVKINLDQFYFLPEIGLGINISNTTKQFIKYSNGDTEIKWRDQSLINGKFNKLSIPISLSVGKDYKFDCILLSAGIKGYYGLNQVVNGVSRDAHYFGIGVMIAIHF